MKTEPDVKTAEESCKEALEYAKQRIDELKEENTRLRNALKGLIGMAEDGYRLHVKNGSHQEFLQEDQEALMAAYQLINPSKS